MGYRNVTSGACLSAALFFKIRHSFLSFPINFTSAVTHFAQNILSETIVHQRLLHCTAKLRGSQGGKLSKDETGWD
jgi:hypothetical protein